MEINILPFMCDAITLDRHNFDKIDKIYKLNKFEYYRLAKQSSLYNSSIISDSDFLKEEYNKKLLGICLCIQQTNDIKLVADIDKIIKESYRYTYTYYLQNNTIDLSKFLQSFVKKMKGIDNITDDELNYNMLILYFLANNSNKKIIKNEMLEEFEKSLLARLEFSKKDTILKINLKHANLEEIEQIKNEIGIIDRSSILKKYNNNVYTNMISYLFDYESITTSMFDYINMTEKDILEIVYLIEYMRNKNKSAKELDSSNDINNCIILIYLRYMIKSYKEMKKAYFENNKETMYIDLEFIESQLKDSNNIINSKDREIEQLRAEIKKKDKYIKKLENKITENKLYRDEMISLRNFFFNSENDLTKWDPLSREENFLKDLEGKKFFVLGGHDTLQAKLKEHLKNSIFIHTDNLNFDTSLINNSDKIIVFSNYLNHAIYYKVVDKARQLNKSIQHINNTNIDLILHQID